MAPKARAMRTVVRGKEEIYIYASALAFEQFILMDCGTVAAKEGENVTILGLFYEFFKFS